MLGYIVLLCLALLLSLAVAAAVLAARMRWQVKPVPDDTAHTSANTAQGNVLGYAPAPYVPPLLDRWPVLLAPVAILAGAVPIVAAASLPWVASSRNLVYELVASMFFVPPAVAGAAYLVGSVALCARGLRRAADGRPAAAEWELLPILKVIGASAAVLLFVAGMMDWKARQKIAEMAQRAEARVRATGYRPLPDDANAKALYEKAQKTYKAGKPIRWQIDPAWQEPKVPPPPFPADQLPTLKLVDAATAMGLDLGEPYVSPVEWFTGASCNVLQLHAANAAMAGDMEQAIKDIATLQRQASQMATSPWDTSSMLAVIASDRAMKTIQLLLPLAENEQQLDTLFLPDRQWYRDTGRNGARASQAYMMHYQCRGMTTPLGTAPLQLKAQRIVWRDLCAADDLEQVERYLGNILACWDVPGDSQVAQSLLREMQSIVQDVRRPGKYPPILHMAASTAPLYPLQALTQRDLTEAAIAATRYRLRHGRLPQSWHDLTSTGLLKAIPQDLFTGKPATMTVSADHVLFAVDRVPIMEIDIQAIAATRPLWEIFGSGRASTQPVTKTK